MAAIGEGSRQGRRQVFRKLQLSWSLRKTVSGFWTVLVAAIGALAALVTILTSVGLWERRGYFETGGFETTVVRAEAMHIGNSPQKNVDEFYGPAHSLFFNVSGVDPSQMAVLTFETSDVRAPTHFKLNGRLLPLEPAILNSGYDTWDTVFILIDKGLLRSTGNELRFMSLDDKGGTTGDLDDIRIRNIAVLYKTR